ncbi:MAG: acyl-CoA dehydrogenase C-terminal domain-containing protein [Rhodospirillaceae bacterium]
MTYSAPVADMRFALNRVIGLDRIAALPGYEDATPDLVDSVLEEAGKFAAGVLAPINAIGDREGSKLENGVVRQPECFRAAYKQYVEAGWNGVPFEPEYGGQGLPWALAFAVQEMWQSANMAFGLCPMLNQGAVELLSEHGSPEQKETYLAKLISGEWTGTMDLTESSAGSDLGAVRTKAVPSGDHYLISGTKIFITYGEHDQAENIIHLVLARLPDAPAGSRGISLFIAPKFLVNADGSLGARNDLLCTGLEHKLGIMASPTAVLSYGDQGGAVGTMVGEPGRGLEYMFSMMNNARQSVGLQGLAIAERAYQQAREYARTRIQSKDLRNPRGPSVAIINHPDVRRMLLTMKSQIEAARILCYEAGAARDIAKAHPDAETRAAAQTRIELLTPVVKAWCTDLGCEIASTGIQVHGGMGYIEETGAAQHLRDARIAPIYEGTNGIQANDLVFRKLGRDQGAAALAFIAEMKAVAAAAATRPGDDLKAISDALFAGTIVLEQATNHLLQTLKPDPAAAAAGAANYLRMFGLVTGGSMLARAATAACDDLSQRGADHAFLTGKIITARFYAEQILPQAAGLLVPITQGANTVMALSEEQF